MDVASASSAQTPAPMPVRVVAWFFLAASLLGFAGGILDVVRALRGGPIVIPLPLAVGVTGLALFRGLHGGDKRAWKWARRLTGLAILGLLLMGTVLFVAPENATFSLPGGEWDARDALALVLPFVAVAIGWFGWQFRALGRPAVREYFGLATP